MARTGTALAMLLVLVLGCRRSPSNNPPDTPAAPAGPRWSALDRSVPFVSAADDPDEDSVAYQLDWGDGGRSAWTGLQPSGVPVSVFHVWNSLGSYSVLVRVRDVAGDSSDWSPAHVLTVDSSAGYLYHGIYPGGVTGEEDDITPADLQSYEQTVGKTAAWVYFSHNWYHGRQFPVSTCTWIRDAGSVPFVRLMMRSDAEQDHAETLYTLERIVAGEFDADLRAWARAARDFGSPILADYGVEMNGEWFPWNGAWNGGDSTDGYGDPIEPDGPERFRDAYKHIIGLCREEGAANVTWVFHVDDEGSPDEDWNQFENYYPGDDWIDWIGVSVYGALTPDDPEWPEFAAAMDAVYPRLLALARGRPIVVFEFGVTSGNPLGDQAAWADSALTGLTSFYWPRVTGFSWWNERWENEHGADTDMRVQDNPGLAEAFHRLVGNNPEVHGRLSYPR